MDPLHLVVWIIAAMALAATGIVVAIDATIAWHLGYPLRRPVLAAVFSFLVLSSGFVVIILLLSL